MDPLRRLLLKGLLGSGVAMMMPPMLTSTLLRPTRVTASELNQLRSRAARLADYATFGANEATVAKILDYGWEAWVDEQLASPTTLLYPSATLTTEKPTATQFYSAWWTNALSAEDQLRQRLGFALSQWFVISSNHPFLSGRIWTVIDYYDMLLAGIDGSFDDLLYQVSIHPAMCAYLSSLYNEKANPELGSIPDENYAREILQLFSCGAEKRYRNGNFAIDSQGQRKANYTEDDIRELARVFTGIGIKDAAAWGKETGDWLSPVIEYPDYHDYGSKTLFGQTIPGGLDLFSDIRAAINIILQKHQKSVAGNFSRFMIQLLTVSNPRPSYVRDVSIPFIDSGWDLKTLFRTILLHPDAMDGRSNSRSETGRVKEPLLWYASARRAIAPPRDQQLQPLTGPLFNNNEPRTAATFNQAPLFAPNVFGFFPRDYQPEAIKGEQTNHITYVYPEAFLYDWNNVVTASNKLWGNFIAKKDDVVDFMAVLESGASNEEFVDYVLDRILFGNYRQALRETMIELLNLRGAAEYTGKLRDALVLATASPDFLVINLPQEV